MIKYLKNNPYGSVVYQTRNSYQTKYFNLTVLKKLMKLVFLNYESYKESFFMIFNKKRKIPIYINDFLYFIPTANVRSYDNIWINLCAVKKIIKGNKKTKIIFIDDDYLLTHLKLEELEKYYALLEKIKAYFKKTKTIDFLNYTLKRNLD